ncbi:MAG: hypothetical protein M5U28_35375 [Sandaracinaceae bacterium]|nr:hypothetical protein [Sandaracinaceae bacterium]
MSLLDLAALYALVGVGCAVVVFKKTHGSRRRRAGSAALAMTLWPIWAPLALVPDPPRRTPASGRVARIEAELERATAAAAGSPFEVLLPEEAAERIRTELRQAALRIDELDAVLAQPGFDLAEAERRVGELTGSGSSTALRTAVLHQGNVARLEALRDRHARALEELGELVGALRSQLVLARYAGSSPEGVGGIVTELWARVDGLGEAMDAHATSYEEQEIA